MAQERLLVNAVEIVGNRKIDEAQIRKGLLIRADGAVDAFRMEMDRKFILDLYKKAGNSEATVHVDQKLLERDGIVRYQIIEKPLSAPLSQPATGVRAKAAPSTPLISADGRIVRVNAAAGEVYINLTSKDNGAQARPDVYRV